MAADDTVKSELEEARRLLAIDSLVRKYCGNGAQEYFRVVSVRRYVVLFLQCSHLSCGKTPSD